MASVAQVEYREHPKYPGYRVGNDGTVWSKRRGGPYRQLGGSVDSWGYRQFLLRLNGESYTRFAHHLVLEVFVCHRPTGMECRHLDGDKTNNRLSNLAWGTPKENAADKCKHGAAAQKLTPEAVKQIRAMRQSGKTLLEIANKFGVCFQTVSDTCLRKRWKHVA